MSKFIGYWSKTYVLDNAPSALELGESCFRYWTSRGYLEGTPKFDNKLLTLSNADDSVFHRNWTLVSNGSTFGLLPIDFIDSSFFRNEPLWIYMMGLVSRNRPKNWPSPWSEIHQPGFCCSSAIEPSAFPAISDCAVLDFTLPFRARSVGSSAVKWTDWLERCLLSDVDVLVDCVSQLTLIALSENRWAENSVSFDKIFEIHSQEVLENGLNSVDPSFIETLLSYPKYLFDLREILQSNGGKHWTYHKYTLAKEQNDEMK